LFQFYKVKPKTDMKKTIVWLCCLLALFACNNNTDKKANANKPDVLAANMDSTVSPADDFFAYANGGWIKANPIPGEESSWGVGNLVIEENATRLRTINEKAVAENAAAGSTAQKIADFWKTAMDTVKIEADGIKPIQPLLDKVNAVADLKSLQLLMAELGPHIGKMPIGFYVSQDAKNSEVMAMQMWQSGLGLPEREYYFKTDSATVGIRNAYVQYMRNMLVMVGEDSAKSLSAANAILAMETKLAQSHRKLADLRDPYKNYNKMAYKDLYKLAPQVDWDGYKTQRGLAKVDTVIVGQPEYVQAVGKTLSSTPLDLLKTRLKFGIVDEFAGMLPNRFGLAAFNFSKLLSGAKEQKPRWKRVIRAEENVMGELLGQLYAKEFFSEKAKERYTKMVEDVRDALKERIARLSWMSDSTKQKAYTKLAAIKKKVGYPDKWKDFSALNIGTESYVQNMMNANLFWDAYQLNKLGKPVDRDAWEMYPQTYNAYYNPSNNEIVLPAGIFTVPGYRDEELDDATVYGYGGASTIGHEITHGFDDEGRQFDEKGNLKSWWTAKDETEFKKRADVMVAQFDAYEPLPGSKINGRATLGENIADLGGILLGIDAFKKTEQYKKGEKIAGLEPMKRYFMGYALGWLGHTREESLRNQLMTDVHSPAKYRVNGPFVDVDEFYSTFSVGANAKMYRADSLRVRIW
jgi:putative endopeptidase